MATNSVGKVTQVLGAVVDVQFAGDLPPIMNALHAKIGDRVLDVQAGDCRRPFVQSPSSMMLKRLVFPKGLRSGADRTFDDSPETLLFFFSRSAFARRALSFPRAGT